jgi:hypothetical protein
MWAENPISLPTAGNPHQNPRTTNTNLALPPFATRHQEDE